MNRVAIYLRKSRADVEAESLGKYETLSTHRTVLKELAKQKNLKIVKIYEEIVSGESIRDRFQMQQLLEDVYNNKYDAVLVMDIDRLGRGNAKDQGTIIEAFKYSNTLIITPVKTYDANDPFDEEYLEFGQFMSRKELKMINRRMQAGRLASKKKGNYVGAFAPYGYSIHKPKRGVRTLIPNHETKNLNLIFEWASNGLNVKEIAERLTTMGILTRQGKTVWSRQTIRQILTNELYLGKVIEGKQRYEKVFDGGELTRVYTTKETYDLYEGTHEPLIDQETFDKIQKQFNINPPTKRDDLLFVFAGIIRCSKCSVAIGYKPFKKPNTKARIHHHIKEHCAMKSVYYQVFYDSFISQLKNRINDFKIELKNNTEDSKLARYEATKQTMTKELKTLETKRGNLFDMLEDGTYTKSEFLERKEIYNKKIELLSTEIDQLEKPKIINYDNLIYSFSDILDSLDNEEIPNIKKNKLLKSIIERIDYTNTNGHDIEIAVHFKF